MSTLFLLSVSCLAFLSVVFYMLFYIVVGHMGGNHFILNIITSSHTAHSQCISPHFPTSVMLLSDA